MRKIVKMSSSVELHRKLNRIEAQLHAENEARKMDSPTIDFRLESPKTPRQRPGKIHGLVAVESAILRVLYAFSVVCDLIHCFVNNNTIDECND